MIQNYKNDWGSVHSCFFSYVITFYITKSLILRLFVILLTIHFMNGNALLFFNQDFDNKKTTLDTKRVMFLD